MHQAPWTPSVDRCSLTKRDKINIEASQSHAGRKLIKLLGSLQSYRNTAVLYKYRRISAI